MTELLFYPFAILSLGSAAMAISRKNAVSSACWLVLMFFGLAGAFVLMQAYFVAAVQILVYAGAIMVLFLFVIMLIDLKSEDLALQGAPRLRPIGVLAALAFLGVSVWAVLKARVWDTVVAKDPSLPDGSAGAIGDALFNVWLLAFEATSLLLLGGILGAVILTKRRLT